MSDQEGEWVLYRNRPEWSDIKPVEQDDGPNPVVAIAYTEKFKDVYDYFRAVLQNDEKSERALCLSKDAALENPANYTVWHYRREMLKVLNKDLRKELDFASVIIKDHPKNYQIWYHRQKIVESLKSDPSEELVFIAEMLDEDSKNYHAWQYRQWIIATYSLWDKELDFVTKLLSEDIRNNSAWNQRYFVVSNTTGYSDEVLQSEVKYTLEIIRKAPSNESAWNYLEGIFKGHQMSTYPGLKEFCEQLSPVPSAALLCFMVSLYEGEARALGNNVDGMRSHDRALEICNQLSTKVDTIRQPYWEYTSKRLSKMFTA